MADSHQQWDSVTTDFNSGVWIHSFCQLPFLNAKIKRFVEERGGATWKALDVGCGMGKHTIMFLKAGASYVLALDISKIMVDGAKMATDKFVHSQSIPGAEEGTFDLAFCVYVLCNFLSKEEVKQAFAEIYKMLKPGGKLIIYETHVLQYMRWDDESMVPLALKRGAPKEDSTKWSYFEDEGKPREITMRVNSGRELKFINRFYTLSSWVSWILEAGFQITQFEELHLEPKAIPADAPDYVKFTAGKPVEMCWECTKPLTQ